MSHTNDNAYSELNRLFKIIEVRGLLKGIEIQGVRMMFPVVAGLVDHGPSFVEFS